MGMRLNAFAAWCALCRAFEPTAILAFANTTWTSMISPNRHQASDGSAGRKLPVSAQLAGASDAVVTSFHHGHCCFSWAQLRVPPRNYAYLRAALRRFSFDRLSQHAPESVSLSIGNASPKARIRCGLSPVGSCNMPIIVHLIDQGM